MTAVLDLDRRLIIDGDKTVRVSKSAARLLERIVRGHGDFSSLCTALWPNPAMEPDWGENTIRVMISRVRAACRRAGINPLVGTRFGSGYITLRPIEIVMSNAPIVIPAKFRNDLCAILSASQAHSARAMLALAREGQ